MKVTLRSEARLLRRAALGGLLGCGAIAMLAPGRTEAGVPPPNRSVCRLSEPSAPCHYRFRADGGLDVLTVHVTLRDQFDTPVPDVETSVTLNLLEPPPGGGPCGHATTIGAELCSCCPLSQTAISAADGSLSVQFARLGGRGTLEVAVTALGVIWICTEEIVFTSPDLDGSCETSGTSTSIIDLGIWAGCYSPNPACNQADYNCDCQVDVVDIAIFGGGLGLNCGGGDCP